MSYRSPNVDRIGGQQSDNIFAHAGQTAIWRRYVSASAGIDVAGFDITVSYTERTITALLSKVEQPESQVAAGMIAGAQVMAVTREPLARQDELTWRGIKYRVESDSAPARLAGTWTCILKRATP